MLRARRISPRDSRRSGMPLNVDGWCEVVLQLTDGVRSARAHASRPEKDPRRSEVLESHSRRGSNLYVPPDSVARAHRPGTRCLQIRRQLNSTLDFLFPCIPRTSIEYKEFHSGGYNGGYRKQSTN